MPKSRNQIVCIGLFMVGLLLFLNTTVLARHRGGAAPARTAAGENEESATETKSGLSAPYVSACVMEPHSGTIIFDKEMHKPWPPASMTKMMLMLIVVEKLKDGSLKLTDPITTSAKASKIGGSQVYLKEGETFPLDEMMKAIVVHSANDASVAVAEYIGGSTDAFVQMMNQEVEKLGLKDTHYYSPHGLPPGPGEQPDMTSAYDSARLAQELIKYPDVLRWSAINVTGFRNGTFELRNTNHLVRTYPGCDGLKTGFYYKSGFDVTATAQRKGVRLIAVVMGSPRKNQNFSEAAGLMSQGFLNYFMYPVARKGAAAGQAVPVKGGAQAELKPVWGEDLQVFIKHGDEKSALKIDYSLPASVTAPVKSGQKLGSGTVLLDGKKVGSAELVASKDVAKGSMVSRLLGF